MRNRLCAAVLLATLAFIPCRADKPKETLPVTTKSAEALKHYHEGMKLRELTRTDEALAAMKKAVAADPDFALAWVNISMMESNPALAKQARAKAAANAPNATAGEHLFVEWVVNRSEADLVKAIANANDLLASYPDDKRILWLVGQWLSGTQGQWERDIELQEHALAIDPNYLASLNDLGYGYAQQRKFDKAIANMKRYTELAPSEPNPHDSMAEILRLAGRFDDAIVEYKQALKIMPDFHASQQGIADTFALMGNQSQARAEYAKCAKVQSVENVPLLCRQMSAYSYIRENKMDDARTHLLAFANEMKAESQTQYETEALVALAFIAETPAKAVSHLDQATRAISADAAFPKADREEIIARILAHKARILLNAGRTKQAAVALNELARKAEGTRDPVIYAALHGARGASYLAQKQYADAILELQDDQVNPFSSALLVQAYRAYGKKQEADSLKESLATLRRLEIDLWMAQQMLKN